MITLILKYSIDYIICKVIREAVLVAYYLSLL